MRLAQIKYTLFFVFFLLCLAGRLPAQPSSTRFERMGVEKGFSNSVITTFFQDSRGFLWIGGYAGLHRYDGYELTPYYFDPGDSLTIGDNKVTGILESRDGNLWIGTQNGLNYFDRKTETFRRFFSNPDSVKGLSDTYILSLLEDGSGRIWAGTKRDAIIFDPRDETISRLEVSGKRLGAFTFHHGENGTVWLANSRGLWKTGEKEEQLRLVVDTDSSPIWAISKDASGGLWLGGREGLFRYRPEEETIDQILLDEKGSVGVRSVLAARNGTVWCGTPQGVFRYHPSTGKLEHFQHSPDDEYSLSGNYIEALFEGRAGNIWVGTAGGACLFRPSTEKFRRFPDKYQSRVGVSAFRSFLEAEPGKLLLWDIEQGLVLFDWRKGTREPFPHRPTEGLDAWNTGITCFFRDDQNRIWMGALGGVFVFNPADHSFSHYHKGSESALALSDNMIRDICQDTTGAIWLATWNGGINCILEDEQKVKAYHSSDDGSYRHGARRAFVGRDGTVWAGTRGGLLRYNRNEDKFRAYRRDPNDPNSMSENTAFDIYEDDDGFLWIGAYGGGLNKFDPQTEKFTHYTPRNGLPGHSVFSILPDDQGHFWLSTYKGIVRFDPEEDAFKMFDYRDGLLNKQYDAFSHYRIPSTGELVYEGKQGIDIFHPDSLQPGPAPPTVLFTDFLIANQPVPIRRRSEAGMDGFFLDQSITETKELAVPYRHKTLTFKFASPYFSNPEKVRYSYRLEGFDKEWQDIGNQRTATFTNLPPGKYRLAVRAANADGVSNKEDAYISLAIIPPWWLTWWAYGLYALAIGLLFYAYLRYQRRRWRLQADLEARQREAERLQELDTVKSQLYTNISHEFRTPLTVILGLNDEILRYHQNEETGRLKRAADLIRRNSRRVLQLVNQMLDLARLEAGRLALHFQQGEVVDYLRYLTESYESLAESRGIELTFAADPPELVMDYDEEKLHQIFTNLLANALKFTPEGGKVDVRISKAQTEAGRTLRLEVRDNGPGISADKRPHIFNRFYQVDASSSRPGEGTGIGLTLTKELVELHGGRIEVDSEEGRGASFTVYLPITNQAPPRKEAPSTGGEHPLALPLTNGKEASGPAPAEATEDGLPTLLIVEDAPDIITYLKSCLQGRYDIRTAPNGHLGLEAARKAVPDIIISDVMMPEMDGLDMCEKLKTDECTSHIPIVLLTAKATVQDRLAGLQRGADAYLPKPFNKEELLIRLEKLVELRQKLRKRYAGLTPPPATDDPALQQEDEFVRKAREAVEAHLDDDTFGPAELIAAVHLSRTQVHRKLKALTGKSTAHFIRSVRLQRAMELLKAGQESVQAVAYEVGFSDPAYFSRVFAEEFGGPPSTFMVG